MNIKPIRNESDYDQALQRVETLWGAPAGTPEGDEVDILIPLVEAYEREHYPIDLPTQEKICQTRQQNQSSKSRLIL